MDREADEPLTHRMWKPHSLYLMAFVGQLDWSAKQSTVNSPLLSQTTKSIFHLANFITHYVRIQGLTSQAGFHNSKLSTYKCFLLTTLPMMHAEQIKNKVGVLWTDTI